ncbi:hypothetical protein MMA231_04197 (plasmid) [Asticcacaulis sp. MM231]|uniref:hypothetical protein n=1 Tax=Asticcacaulis sp. MM231 TaxID=3157666 RepID=UPI0032D5AEBE
MPTNATEEIAAPRLEHLTLEQMRQLCANAAIEAGAISVADPVNRLAKLVETLALVLEAQLERDL